MARTFLRQAAQIKQSDLYDDELLPSSSLETQSSIEGDLNALRSQLNTMLTARSGNWYDDLSEPSALDAGTKRGINALNTDLHGLERKRVLVGEHVVADVQVGAGNNFVILGSGELPSITTLALGAVTTAGVVAAQASPFGAHSMAEVAGATAVAPKNLCAIVDGITHDPILSDNRVVYALMQSESATDGSTISASTPNRIQLSFVRLNSAGNDLEAVPSADIAGKFVNYDAVERKALLDLAEEDFLRGAITDNLGGSTTNLQVAFDNQSTVPVDVSSNATFDLEGPGLEWAIRDDVEADLLKIIEGSAGSNSTIQITSDVDILQVSAVDVDFVNGIKVATGSMASQIDIGVDAGKIASFGDLKLDASSGLYLKDVNVGGSTWASADGIALSAASAEWDDFKTAFGEVSLLNAITQAKNTGNVRGTKVFYVLGGDVAPDTNVTTGVNMAGGDFVAGYDVYLNGNLLQGGPDASANNDYYPGSNLNAGDLKFEFELKANDVIAIVPYSAA